MIWTPLSFGRHEGKTLPQILFNDPDWFFWAYEQKTLFKDALAVEAEDLHKKATHIRIKQEGPEKLVAEYLIHEPTRKFATVDLVPVSRPPHSGGSPVFERLPVLDLSVPRRIANYDKMGGKMLLGQLKHHVFGEEKARMTKQRCEGFFDDPVNFDF